MHRTEFLNALSKQLPVTTFDSEALNNVYEELTRKLCNTRSQEFLSATNKNPGVGGSFFLTLAPFCYTLSVITLLSNHTKLSSTV